MLDTTKLHVHVAGVRFQVMIPRRVEEGHLQLAEYRTRVSRAVLPGIHVQIAGAEEEVSAERIDGVQVREQR